MKNPVRTLFVLILLISAAMPALANVKVRTERTSAGQTYEDTIYIKNKRRRAESMNGSLVSITQCDAGREISLNPALRKYSVSEFGTSSRVSASPAAAAPAVSPARRGGTVTMTSTVKDTGERKQFFGYTARRIKTLIVIDSSADACAVNNSKMETDGWYIDETFGFDCGDRPTGYESPAANNGGGCRDNFVTKTNGTAKKGFAVYEKMLIYGEEGRDPFEITTEVKEISKEPVDDALFEIPDGYTQVGDRTQLYAAAVPVVPAGGRGSMAMPTSSVPAPSAAPAENDGPVVTEKKAGTIRIGLANIKVAAAGEGVPAEDLAVAFRNTLAEYLKTPDIEIVLLESRLPAAVKAEAEKLDCDAVLFGTVSHKKGGGGFGGMFGKVIAPAVGGTGIGHTGSVAGNIAGQAATYAVINAGTIAANTKAKDEITFDLDLSRTGASGLRKQYKRKAKSAGEDLITSIVEEAATEIVATLSR